MINRSFLKIKIKPNRKSSLLLNQIYDKKINLWAWRVKKIKRKKQRRTLRRLNNKQSSRNQFIASVEHQMSKIWSVAIYVRSGTTSIVLVLSQKRSLIMTTNLTTVNTARNALRHRRKTRSRKHRPKKMMIKSRKTIKSPLSRLRQTRNPIIRRLSSRPLPTTKLNVNKLLILTRKRTKIKAKKSQIQARRLLHWLKQPKRGAQKSHSTLKPILQLKIQRIKPDRILRMQIRHKLLWPHQKLIGKLKTTILLWTLKQ